MRFLDREEAGRQLAQVLVGYRHEDAVVLGLPRGGVPVAYEVASALEAPLDVWVVRKVGAPGHAEFGIGAVAEGGIVFLNPETLRDLGLTESDFHAVVQEKSAEVAHRVQLFRGGLPSPRLEGRTVILVDDGIATGGTIRAAIQSLRVAGPRRLVLAVPVAASQSLDDLAPLVDEVVCLHSTPELYAIGAWYDDFEQVPDREVLRLLEKSRRQRHAPSHTSAPFSPQEISIPIKEAQLEGILTGPSAPQGLVLFAHGSGSSRLSPRNNQVASMLHHYGLATLLFDLLTSDEETYDEETAELRFDIQLLAGRLVEVTDWARIAPLTRGLPVGYFGSSTGAAAALVAAARRQGEISAVVSRGGRPDLAWDSLPEVRSPTLLIVGGEDQAVLELNQRAYARLRAPKQLVVVPGATHLFEEPGTLDEVARLAGEWFRERLAHREGELELGVT
ncbi:MAG: phosphoribosyltransferase [Myxococcota bacterium]|nr:phosphoribosyltransferase [Myxococcota bacterium]